MFDHALDNYSSAEIDDLMIGLGTTREGLTTAEAQRRLKACELNILEIRSRVTPFRMLVKQFSSPLILILLFAVAVSVIVREWADAVVISAIVVGSGLVSFVQEYSAANAVVKLRERLSRKVPVLRDARPQEVDVESIVPGDVVTLSAGSLIPADGVVLEVQDLFVNQAVLTGETFPVNKTVGAVGSHTSLADLTNCVFMGTSVRSGMARMLVVRVGVSTEYGKIADRLSQRPPETEFERGIRRFGLMLTRITVGLILAVFAINVISLKPPIDALLFAIALAVGISPELLPAIITINLAKGAREMARQGVIVRHLESIENLGSMDVLCTDKTGTLTEGVIRLDAALNVAGNPSNGVYRLAYLNAFYQSGLSNPLDEAIVSGPFIDISRVRKVGEVPYDFTRKRLSVTVDEGGDLLTLITKGALDNVLAVCSRVRFGDTLNQLNNNDRDAISEKFRQWSGQGFRVLGIATKQVRSKSSITRGAECEMVFEGFLLFLDPPKEGVADAIESLAALKIKLCIITGDNRHIALHVAETVGMRVDGILPGEELSKLDDEALWHVVEHTNLFVEVDPNQKDRIIRALQRMGHVVGYMGDGINDAPALHDADAGISVEGAVDVAREAADFVLLRKGLDVLQQGIEEGRVTFANSLKYIFTTTSANFGNMFSMAGASLFLPFLPLLAKQILLNNFLSDIPAITIAGDNVDREYVERPHRWDIRFIRNFIIVFGLISSFFDFLTFGLLFYFIQAAEQQFRTAWFVESLLTEIFVALVVRTRRPFYKSKPGRWLWVSTVAVGVLTLSLPYIPGADILGFVPLPVEVLALIGTVTLMYLLATEIAKRAFYKQYEAKGQ